jgi:hypothetical protein
MTITITDRFRDDAVACLVQIVRDENASPAARAQAARDILAYSDGRPQAARQITVADIGRMTEAQRHELLHALLTHYLPEGALQDLLRQSVDDAVRQLPPPPTPKWGFTRGSDAPTPRKLEDHKASTRNELEGRARRYADSREPEHRDEGALKTNSLDAELPPPRSPQHSPNPEGSNGQDYTRLLERYNFRSRNGSNGNGHGNGH